MPRDDDSDDEIDVRPSRRGRKRRDDDDEDEDEEDDRPRRRSRYRADDDEDDEEDERPSRRRSSRGSSRGFRCPYCDSSEGPYRREKTSSGGWVIFVVLLILFFPLCWIGLLMKEEYRVCGGCGVKIGG